MAWQPVFCCDCARIHSPTIFYCDCARIPIVMQNSVAIFDMSPHHVASGSHTSQLMLRVSIYLCCSFDVASGTHTSQLMLRVVVIHRN